MLLAILLAVSADPVVEGPHFALSAGVGLAYAYAGVHAEVRYQRFAFFLATTPFGDVASQWPLTENATVIAAGLRYFPGAAGSGLLFSIQATRGRYDHHLDTGYVGSDLDPAGYDTYTATIGWRWRWKPLFLEAALGGGWAHDFDHRAIGLDSTPGPLYRRTYPYPDGALAVGLEF